MNKEPHGSGVATIGAIAVDAGDLSLGGGLLALVRPALETLPKGGVLAVLSTSQSARDDLPVWCRIEHHDYLERTQELDGRDRHLIARGPLSIPVEFPNPADVHSGFAPKGARIEPGGPAYPFTLIDRDRVSPPEVAQLYEQAAQNQWDATGDIPWSRLPALPTALENAVAQTMTFLAENELSALYVPAKFLSRIHPAYAETAMFLATQMADEARHFDVFTKRARAGGAALGISSTTTSRSLLSLLQTEDFNEAGFLLTALGEGTFLDLLRYIEEHAPDPVTAEIARRTRADEARHVHFGLAHVRHALANDSTLFQRLEQAVRRRAANLAGVSGVPAPIADALTILGARGTDPKSIARGHENFRELLHTMHEARIKRLSHAGFSEEQAQRISELHTPNFM